MVKNKLKTKFPYRILRILLIVIVALIIILGTIHVFTSKKFLLSPQQKIAGNCQKKTWCLDYNTIAYMGADCSALTRDCFQGDKCVSGKCVTG